MLKLSASLPPQAFLVLLTDQLVLSLQQHGWSDKLSPHHKAPASCNDGSLNTALLHLVPSSLTLRPSEEKWWNSVVCLLLSNNIR